MPPSISFPPSGSAVIETLNGSNWPTWSSCITALLRMNGLKALITEDKTSTDTDWDRKEEIILGILEIYCQKDVWTTVADDSNDSKFKTCKTKWAELKRIYGGIGSMSSFNTWVTLTSTALDELSLMLAQL